MRMLAAFLFSAPVLAAGPLNPAWVAADAAWVVHIDVEAVMASHLGPFLVSPPTPLRARLDEVRAEIGLDPLKDIKSITVYGSSGASDEGMVIIASSPAVDGVLEHLKGEGEYAKVEDNGVVFHTWKQGAETHYATVRDGPEEGGNQTRILFLAGSREHIDQGLRVVDGEAPRRAADEPAPGLGSMLFVHGKDIPEKLRRQVATNFIKMVDGLLVDVGESTGKLYASVTLVADSSENVAALMQSVQRVLAFARLGAQGDPELSRLCDSISLSTDGLDVAARLTCDIGDALRELRKKTDGDAPAAHRKDGDAGPVSTKARGER